MSTKPLLLDLYCGAGGAAWGYHLAGFRVIGVDWRDQPSYPFGFLQADALEVLARLLAGREVPYSPAPCQVACFTLADLAAIHASPPCQFATVYNNNRAHVRDDHPNLIPGTRFLLRKARLPYVIENVPGARAHLDGPVQLCGTSFGIEVRRHRLFESTVQVEAPPCDHGRFTERKYPGSSNRPNGRTVCNVGEWRVPLPLQRAAMEISWMSRREISQAIPPAYTRHIGMTIMRELEHA